MGVNQQVFERYVNGDETALMGMPVQKQIKFRELRNVLSRFFGDYPERMKPEFAIALIDDQCFLMDKCRQSVNATIASRALLAGAATAAVMLGAGKIYQILKNRRK